MYRNIQKIAIVSLILFSIGCQTTQSANNEFVRNNPPKFNVGDSVRIIKNDQFYLFEGTIEDPINIEKYVDRNISPPVRRRAYLYNIRCENQILQYLESELELVEDNDTQ